MTPSPPPGGAARTGLLPWTVGSLLLAVATFATLTLFQIRAFDQVARDTARVERLLASASADLRVAQTGLLTIAAELRRLRAVPPAEPPVYLIPMIRKHRAEVERALDRYAARTAVRGTPASAPGLRTREGRATERAALAEARAGLGALDSLIALAARREPIPVGSVDYAVGSVSVPVTRLMDLDRAAADQLRGDMEARRSATRERALLGLLLAVGLVAGSGLLLARSVARVQQRLLSALASLSEPDVQAASFRDADLVVPGAGEALARGAERFREEREEAQTLRERMAAQELRIAELERTSEYKTWFIGHVSHEFRTPLSSIIGFTSLLVAEHTQLADAKRAEYLDIVLRNGRHLLHVINDILNLSKVEAGTLEVTPTPLYTAEVITSAVTSLRPQAEERKIDVRFTDASKHLILADAGRLRQVVLNLLENAIKYSPPNRDVDIRVTSDPSRVRVEIRDRGPGISEEDRWRLFKEFSRIKLEGVKVSGAGLGLALSKRLVELMGGHIGVNSRPGEGSTFWVTLPSAGEIPSSVPPQTGAAARPARSRGEVIAVVDDDPDIRAYAAAVIQRSGYRAVVDPGSEGLAGRLAPEEPALVLLDLNLENRSGIEALAEIRGNERLRQVPVVAFTAATGGEEMRRFREAGFRKFLRKPLEPDALVQAIDEMVSEFSPPGSEPPEDDYLAPLRERFRAGLTQRLQAMEALREQEDTVGLAREVHKLRGAAMGYGFAELSESAGEAEEALRAEGGSPSDPRVASLLHRLREMVGESPF
ncbi:MAG TPA: ATP-binding protein [Longimicrobiaceae bacterium]|nr:ATP-binding protein [Longimicrobiaceae bacterium]